LKTLKIRSLRLRVATWNEIKLTGAKPQLRPKHVLSSDLPPVWWTRMLGVRAGRKVSDEHNAPGYFRRSSNAKRLIA